MATRRATWLSADGQPVEADFDHGAQHITPQRPRFRAAMQRAQAAGILARWCPRVHAAWPAAQQRESFVPLSQMSALCKHLLGGVELNLQQQVQRLQRAADGWYVVAVDGATFGPFEQVLLALPPAQAAVLLAGHHDHWADTLAAVRMEPCWSLMAATQEMDWPWDACEPAKGPLAWVARNDRKPGRSRSDGVALWVAHASPLWSAAHQDDTPEAVTQALSQALVVLLPAGVVPQWQHRSVQRWRYAVPAAPCTESMECWWDASRGLGVCGDFMGRGDAGGVEAAWRSGDELADTLLAALDEETAHEDAVVEAPAEHADERDLAHAD